MGYLTPGDYKKSIQADNLSQIIGNDSAILDDAEMTAIEDVISGLTQKYEVEREFTPTLAWDKSETYHAFDRVYLTAPTFSAQSAYNAGDYVAYQPNVSIPVRYIYKSIVGSVAHAFNPTEWTLLTQEYTIYSPVLPQPEFNYKGTYKQGDKVLWKDKIYTCILPTVPFDAQVALQNLKYENIPLFNVFPDDPANGKSAWGTGVPYSIAPNTEITDTTKWAIGDNRCKQVVWCVVALTLYYIHARIAPRNIPELRENDCARAEKRIKEFAQGDKTPKLPVRQPRQGARVRYGGNIKNNNTW